MEPTVFRTTALSVVATVALPSAAPRDASGTATDAPAQINQVVEWNQIFIDTLILTNTPNSSSQRLGALVHAAIFDAYNGIEQRYTPIFAHNASVHWNQAANQLARKPLLSMSESNPLLAVLNMAMADTAFTVWGAKRFYGANITDVTWRPVTAIPLGETDNNPGTVPEPDWLPVVNTPSHQEYPAGHPSLNGAAATVLLRYFADGQTFTLTTTGQPTQTYTSISHARADGNNARIWGGLHYPSTVVTSDKIGKRSRST